MYSSEHYKAAVQLFHKAKLLTRAEDDPALWNLSNGLEHLAEALQRDIAELRESLGGVARNVKSLK
jgi:hypothetical protein